MTREQLSQGKYLLRDIEITESYKASVKNHTGLDEVFSFLIGRGYTATIGNIKEHLIQMLHESSESLNKQFEQL